MPRDERTPLDDALAARDRKIDGPAFHIGQEIKIRTPNGIQKLTIEGLTAIQADTRDLKYNCRIDDGEGITIYTQSALLLLQISEQRTQ